MNQDQPPVVHDRPAPFTPRTVMGIAIALLGVVLMLDRLGIARADYILRFWPVPIILIGTLMFVQARDGRDRTRGLVFAGIGTWFFLSTMGVITVRVWDLFWPVILILIGVSMAFRSGGPRRGLRGRRREMYRYGGPFGPDGPLGPMGPLGPQGPFGARAPFNQGAPTASGTQPTGEATTSTPAPDVGRASFTPDASPSAASRPLPAYADTFERISIFSVWSNVRRASAASPFRGGDITAIMGGGQLDLRLATIPAGQEAVLDIVAVMGGIEIIVPSTWEVSSPIVPFMGGVEDKRFPPLATDTSARKDNSGRLVLRGFVMMGGVHVKS